jgi:hypothetical protein
LEKESPPPPHVIILLAVAIWLLAPITSLAGEIILCAPSVDRPSSSPVVDGRAAHIYGHRFAMSDPRLPSNAIAQFNGPSIVDRYGWQIVGLISLCIVEAIVILALLIQRAGRRRIEE